MKIEKKYALPIGIGIVAVLAATGGFLYYQYLKLMQYCIKFNNIKINALNANNINFDVVLKLVNQSNLEIKIESQQYSAYVNDSLITKANSPYVQVIKPTDASLLTVNVVINPKDIIKASKGITLQDLLFNQQNVNIKIDLKIKVALYFLRVSIPFTYNATLKDLMAGGSGKSKGKGKC